MKRRHLLQTFGLGGTAALLGSGRALAVPPAPSAAANASVYRFNLGDFECAVISDGTTFFPARPSFGAAEVSDEEVRRVLADHSLPDDKVRFYFSVLLVHTGKELILIDSGAGKNFGDACGKIAAGLATLGYTPDQVTVVHLSHAHFDHFGGLVTTEGKPMFTNARHFVAAAEWDFWMGKEPDQSHSPYDASQRKLFIDQSRQVFETIGNQFSRYKEDTALPDGVIPVAAPGHTPGHCIYRVKSGGEELLHLSDTVTNFAVTFEKPDWPFIFDTEPKQAVATRRATLARVAAEKTRTFGNHLPFPGLGRVRADGNAFRWEAEPWVF